MTKQTAVEYLIEQLFPKVLSQEQYYHIEKAKEMEKQQIIYAYANGHNDGCRYMTNEKQEFEHGEGYFAETYGSKQSEEKNNSQRFDEFVDLVKSLPAEISDKEIEKAKEINWDFMNATEFELLAWIEGAKWQSERMYSEEDMREAYKSNYTPFSFDRIGDLEQDFQKWFEQFKKK